MGCPILLGYAEKALEVARSWESLLPAMEDLEAEGGLPPDPSRWVLVAMRAADPSKRLLKKRATEALRLIVFDFLGRALRRSCMHEDQILLHAVPLDLDHKATSAILQQLKDHALAWKVSTDLLVKGRDRTEGELAMVFIDRVGQTVLLADSLLHDMAQGSYTSAGTVLAHVMAIVKADTNEWTQVFVALEGTT